MRLMVVGIVVNGLATLVLFGAGLWMLRLIEQIQARMRELRTEQERHCQILFRAGVGQEASRRQTGGRCNDGCPVGVRGQHEENGGVVFVQWCAKHQREYQ